MCLDNKKLSVLDWDMVTNPWMYCRTPEKQHKKKPHKEGSMFHDFCLRERFRWGSCSRIPFFIFGFLNVFDYNDLQVFRRWIVSRLLTCSFGIIFCRISLFWISPRRLCKTYQSNFLFHLEFKNTTERTFNI